MEHSGGEDGGGGKDEEHVGADSGEEDGGGGYEEPTRGEDSGEEDEDGGEHLSDDDIDVPEFEGLPIPFNRDLNWEPPENYR